MLKNQNPNNLNNDISNCLAAVAGLIGNNSSQKLEVVGTIEAERHFLLALSGGSDSTALLIALNEIIPAYNFKLTVCHINHGLRGSESEQDAEFCRQLCKQLNIECQIINLPAHALKTGQSGHISEDSLRETRYQYLADFAEQNNISFLLTGHTLDDQVETVLFRLFRGTALRGLRGIEFCRILENNFYLLRPLLKLTKAQCQQFLSSRGIEARQDSSNNNDIYSRNYIRNQVIPTINKRFLDLSSHIDSLREVISAEDEYLNQVTGELLKQFDEIDPNIWNINMLHEKPLALQRRVIAQTLKTRAIEVSFKRLEEIIALSQLTSETTHYLNLNQDWRIKRVNDQLVWQKIQPRTKNINLLAALEVKIPGYNLLPGLDLALAIENYDAGQNSTFSSNSNLDNLDAKGNAIFVDLSKTRLPLVIRQRQPGDKIMPLGMSQVVKLKKYLHTHKNHKPGNVSSQPTILLADQEEVLWLPGIGMSEKIKVTALPSHLLHWQATEPGLGGFQGDNN